MKVLVLGATGGTGKEIVRQAIAGGHAVVALVRQRSRAQSIAGATLVEGDASDEKAIADALSGCDAAVCCLGTGISPLREVTILSKATQALIAGMQHAGARRLVCITGIGAGDSRGHGGALYDWLIQPLLLRTVYDDKDRQEALVRSSGLDWTIVRPGMLKDGPETGRYRVLTDLTGITAGQISRADVAHFVVRLLGDPTYRGATPLITE